MALGVGPVMAVASFNPYVSEFEFASRFHPSINPDCMNRWSSDSDEGNDDLKGANFGYRRFFRSPEEGPPVGQEPSIEVRAILVRCPRNEEETDDILINRNIYNITAARSQDILDFQGFDRDEPEHHSEVRDCRRKLIITMKFNNIGTTKTQEEFVVIDHVLDPVTLQKSRLLNPFVVKVRQEPVLQLYGLKFQGVSTETFQSTASKVVSVGNKYPSYHHLHMSIILTFCRARTALPAAVVNAQAREEVINKNTSNYTGCDDGLENPTCGQMMFEETPIPYSQGFCCSCASELNMQRQTAVLNESLSSFFSRSKLNSIQPSKISRSVNKDSSDDHLDFEKTFRDEELFENSNNPNLDHNGVLAEDRNTTFTKSSDDEETALKNLKNLSRMAKENKKVLDASIHNPDRLNLAAELKRLEEDYKHLRRSSLIRAESENNGKNMIKTQELHPSSVKDFNKVVNDNGPDNYVGIEEIQYKVATKIDMDRRNHILTSPFREEMPFSPAEKQFNFRVPTMSIDVLLAIKPKQKTTTCPVHPMKELPTTCPMAQLTSESLEKTEPPPVLRQKIINDRMYPSRTDRLSYNIIPHQGAADSNSMEASIDSSREFGTNDIELLTNVGISGNVKVPGTNHRHTVKLRPQKMDNATSTENSTSSFPDTKSKSRFTSTRTTENIQHTFDPTRSFDNLSTRVESPTNLSSNFSSRNHSKVEAILLSGSLQNQLANWFSYGKRNRFGRRGRGIKSRSNVGKNSKIGYGNEVHSFAMKILNPTADDVINGHQYEVQMTTSDFHGRVQIHPKTDGSFDGHTKEKTVSKFSDPDDVNVSIPKESESLNVPRSHRSIDDDFVWDETDQQKIIDKEIEDNFMDISKALKNTADDPRLEKDNLVVGKLDLIVDNESRRESMMRTDLPIRDSLIEGPVASQEKIEVKIINPSGKFVSPEISEPTISDMLIDNRKDIGNSKILKHNIANNSNEADNTKIQKLSSSFTNTVTEESESAGHLENHGSPIQSQAEKHTEVTREPVSEFPVTAGPQIIVDRFKIVRPPVDSPKNYEQQLKETLQHDPTNTVPKIPSLEKNEPTPDENSLTTSFHTINRNVESFTENVLTLPPENVKIISTGTTLLPTGTFDSTSSLKNDTSLHSELSPVLTIENLKKELRKEAERYADSSSPLQGASAIARGVQNHPNSVQEVREVNTELTPAEKVEDLVTDEGTLPPDEETGFTTKSLPKTITMSNTVSSSTMNDREKMNYTLIPRRFLPDTEINPRNKKHVVASNQIENVLMGLKKSLHSTSSSAVRLANKRARKKRTRLRRHHLHGISRHRKRSSTESSNRVEPPLGSDKVYVSQSRKPKSHHHAKLAGLKVKKKSKSEDAMDIVVNDEVKKIRAANELPIFHRTEHPTLANDSRVEKSLLVKGKAFIRKMRNSMETETNFQVQPTPKFRSIYPKTDEINLIPETLVDEATGRGDIGKQNKRSDLKTFVETEPEALIFYDYDSIDSPLAAVSKDEGNENKGSLDSLENNNKFRSNAKSDLQPLKKRGNSVSHDDIITAKGFALRSKNRARSMNISDDQFRIEPSGGWKAKMELLKLKKHADVLKEYLNWRHDIVQPEPMGISGYTTKISMTTEKDEARSEIMRTQQCNVSNKTTSMSTTETTFPVPDDMSITIRPHEDVITTTSSSHDNYVTGGTSVSPQFDESNKTTLAITTVPSSLVPMDISVTLQPHEDFITTMTSNNDDHVTRESLMSSFSQSTLISSTNIFLANPLVNGKITTDKVQTSSGNLHTKSQGNAPNDNEPFTGRILPPCCPTMENLATTCRAGLQQSNNRHLSRPYPAQVPHALSKVVPDHTGQLGHIENDLLVISILEKNRLNNKTIVKNQRHQKPSSKIYRIRKEGDPVLDSHHRRHKIKRKIQYSTSSISNKKGSIQRARRLMSIENLDYKPDDEEGEVIFDDYEEIVDRESPVSGVLDALYRHRDNGKLGDEWDQLIDKIIHANSSEFWEPDNSTETSSPERPGDNQSALKQLHFNNADKYIREMARKIVHNSNIRITNLDSDKNKDKNRAGRKLQNYPRLIRRKTISKIRKKNAKGCRNHAYAIGNQRSLRNDRQMLPHSAKKSVYIRKSRAVGEGHEDRSTQYRDHRSFGLEDLQNVENIPAQSNLEDLSESSFADNYDFESEETDDSQPQLLERENLKNRHSNSDINRERSHDINYDYSPDIKVLEIIPLDGPSSESRINNRTEGRERNTKASRMTASQLPKMESDYIPDETSKPDKIKPAELPQGNETEDDKNLKQDIDTSQQNSRAVDAPPTMCELARKNQEQDDMNGAKNPSNNLDANYEIVPLIHVKIEHQPSDKEKVEDNRVPPGNSEDLCPYPDINDGSSKIENNSNREQAEVVTMNMDNDEELREPIGIGSCPESNRQNGQIISSSQENEKIDKIRPTEEPSANCPDITTIPTCKGESNRHCERKRIRLKNILAIMEFVKKIKEIVGEQETHMADTADNQNKEFLFISSNIKTKPIKRTDFEDLKYRDLPSMDSGHFIEHSNEMVERPTSQEGPKNIQEPNTQLPMNRVSETDKHTTHNSTDNSVVIANNFANDHQLPEDKSLQHQNDKTEKDILQNLQQKINNRLEGLNENSVRNQSQDVKVSLKKERSVAPGFSPVTKIKRHHLRSKRMRLRDPRSNIYRGRYLPNSGEVLRTGNEKFRRRAAGKGISKRKRKKKKKTKKRRKNKKHKKKKGKNLRDTEIKGKPWWPFGRQLMSLSDQRESTVDQNLDQDVVPLERRIRRRVHRAKHPHGKKKKTKKRRKHKKMRKKKKKNKKKGKETKTSGLRSKRQIRPGGNQVRGGQDCMDRRHPPGVDPAKYLESAHCLRFSDLWYSVYALENPIMEHTVYLQLFEKHNRADGTNHWEDLTQGSMVRMGTFTRHQRDSTPTIVFTYSGPKTEPQNRALNLDPSREILLVPSPVPPKKVSDYPEIRGGSGEYLVIPRTAISEDGNECDKAGVGFAAFSKQQDRCDQPKGSCLKNQPLDYWAHDMEARESGRPGCYFLSNFASVPSEPIKYNVSGSGSREYLGLEYHSTHVSAIDIQVRSDYNAIVRVGSSGRVTEVYVDSTALEHTVVTVVISNMGLASSPYQPRITDCPSGLPVSWTKAKGIMQVIPPQHDQRVTLDLYGQLLLNEFHCSVEVVNHQGELVAMRRIRVQKMDRCFCVWHCLCACIGSVTGIGCTPMSPEHYHAAGFQGPIPVVTTESSVLLNAVKNVMMLSALVVLLLLLLGILKWFIGLFASAVGRWGLDNLLEGSRIEEYLEPELKCRCVMTDDDGWPVHPDTGQRTVRICSRKFEFFLNLIFFLTYPIAVCCNYCRRSLNSSRQRHCCPDESKMCLINEKGSCPKMICVSTYGDNSNTKLEAEDTRYVMNELKKSQESLQNPKRSKKKNYHKNSKDLSHKNKSAANVNAKKLVQDLLSNRVVFRNLTEPIGGLRLPSGTMYSLRGYFLNAADGGYRFITPCPFKQHWLIENNQKVASEKPPETYPSNLFMRSFSTARHVYESDELSLNPKGICINVQHQGDT